MIFIQLKEDLRLQEEEEKQDQRPQDQQLLVVDVPKPHEQNPDPRPPGVDRNQKPQEAVRVYPSPSRR